jgi:soluble lytic murein transglycosylase-like protein
LKHGTISTIILLVVVAGPALCAENYPESRCPEAVYYADAYADHYHLPRALIHAVITQESGWRPNARSNKGAVGLMQLMPKTAAHFAVQNPISIQDNIGGGVRYLATLTQLFHGDLRMVLAAYYCGEHHILRSGLKYNNVQVITYVAAIQKQYNRELRIHYPVNSWERK